MDESRYDRSVKLLREPRNRVSAPDGVRGGTAGRGRIPGGDTWGAGQGSDRDIAWFDDVHLYDLGPRADRTTDEEACVGYGRARSALLSRIVSSEVSPRSKDAWSGGDGGHGGMLRTHGLSLQGAQECLLAV